MFEVGKIAGRIGEMVAYMYQWDRIPYDTYCGGCQLLACILYVVVVCFTVLS